MTDRPNRRRVLLAGGGVLATPAMVAAASPADYAARWAGAERLSLWPARPPGHEGYRAQAVADPSPIYLRNVHDPDLRVFRAAQPSGQGLLVIPGGAYGIVSIANEGIDVADRLTPHGVTVFVLTYRLPGEGWEARADVPLQDAQRAMRVIRSRGAAFGIDPGRLAALGFSAGGHLTASLATDFAGRVYAPVDDADALSARPFAAGLIYPVITLDPALTHAGSRAALLGPEPSPALVAARSPERHVAADTPPVFLAHAIDDDAVPVDNSLLMLRAMRAAQRPVEAHLFQDGRHAFGIGRPGTPSALWPDLFLAWLDRLDRA